MNYFKFLTLFVLIAFLSFANGQTDSLTKSKLKIRPVYVSLTDFENLNHKFNNFDSTLNNEHHLNPLRIKSHAFQDLGLLGTPIQPLFLNSTKLPGFNFGFNSMDPWLYGISKANEKLIVAPSPYTKLKYAQGEKELIYLEVLHTQNITNRWNVGLDYRRLKTNNYLFNMGGISEDKIRISSIYNLNIFSNYHSKSDKYYVLGSILYNKISLRESGGLIFPASFDSTSGKRRVFDNPLVDATNTISNPTISITNYYRFGKTTYQTTTKDSSKIDTVSFEFKPKGYFFHTVNMSKTSFTYKHPSADTPYYSLPMTDGIKDSMVLKELTNMVGLVIKTTYNQFSNLIKLGLNFSNYVAFNSIRGKDVLNNLSVNGQILSQLASKYGAVALNGKGHYFISGYNEKDYLFNLETKLIAKDKFKLIANLSSQRHVADYFQNIGYTTPIKWDQYLLPTLRNSFEASAEYLPLQSSAGLVLSDFKNYNIYFFDKSPIGIDFNYLAVFVSNSINIKKINWTNKFTYQNVSETYNLPKFSLVGGLYYETKLFKNNMLARFGLDYYWFSSYFADDYNPYLRQFVWQNKTKVGNYPYFDIYMSAQVQTMNIFVKFEHLNQGISGKRYYSTPLYPNAPRFFRFGVNWRLFN